MSSPDPINDPTKRSAVITALIATVVALAALFGVKAVWPSNEDPGTQPTPTPTVVTPSPTPTVTPSSTPPATPTPSPTPQPLRPSWQTTGAPALTFSDEFNDTVVDAKKWETGWFGTGITGAPNLNVLNCYDSKQVSESGGYLHLTAAQRPASCPIKGSTVTKQYVSGMVTTRTSFAQQYGAYEARVCNPDTNADSKVDNWSAWWLNGPSSVSWPAHGEIDIMEGLNGGSKTSVHYSDTAGVATNAGQYTAKAAVGCHNMGVQWTGQTATFYYDGVQVYTHAFNGPYPLWLIFNYQLIDTQPVVVGSATTVDWVRVWK
jgi:beta-glucanase (GH16 family)